jgi:hypothetical protein
MRETVLSALGVFLDADLGAEPRDFLESHVDVLDAVEGEVDAEVESDRRVRHPDTCLRRCSRS